MGQDEQGGSLLPGPPLSSIPQRPSRRPAGRSLQAIPKAPMRTITISNDLVRLSFLAALLRDAGIESVLLDGYVSAIEGSIGAIPRRLAVLPEDERQARRVLLEAGEAEEA